MTSTTTTYEPLKKDFLLEDMRIFHVGWASIDYELWYTQDLELHGDGTWNKHGEVFVKPYPESLKNAEVTSPDGKVIVDDAPKREKGGCGGCSKGKRGQGIFRWLGLRWFGVPQPIRWWRQLHGEVKTYQGCGCIVKLKVTWLVLKAGFNQVRTA